jgi:modification target Cys-rich repeat protein
MHRGLGLTGLGLLCGLAMTSAQGCDPASVSEDICGPCGSIASGQLSISGNARLDGFFTAVADFGKATATIQASFEADIRALASIYGMADGEINAQFIDELKANIKADFQANVDGGIKLVYKPAKCEADVHVAVEAQASCEVNADCEAMVNPGEVSVSCEGTCSGSCSGTCMGEVVCKGGALGAECDVGCEGACELTAEASCSGTCNGTCTGDCTATDANGSCRGSCDGMCMGTCETDVAAECNGTCHGSCHATVSPPSCMAEVECNATCMGECGGHCEGKFEPPSASASCDASADCKAQASAQAEANITCTPPSLDWEFNFNAGVSADAQAAFVARLGELRVRGVAILQGLARAQALINGEIDGEVVFDPPPIANLTAQVQGLISAGISGDIDIPKGRIGCVIPAFEEAGKVLADVTTDFGASVVVQAQFGASLINPNGPGN